MNETYSQGLPKTSQIQDKPGLHLCVSFIWPSVNWDNKQTYNIALYVNDLENTLTGDFDTGLGYT